MFAIIDIETNGKPATGANITEIAVILHNGQRKIGSWERLIKPEAPIPEYISVKTGITNDMVSTAPSFQEIAKELREFLGNAVFVAHNAQFDLRHIKANFKTAGIEYQPRTMCTMKLAREKITGIKRYNLNALCEYFGLTNAAAHRAMGDASVTSEIFFQLLSMSL